MMRAHEAFRRARASPVCLRPPALFSCAPQNCLHHLCCFLPMRGLKSRGPELRASEREADDTSLFSEACFSEACCFMFYAQLFEASKLFYRAVFLSAPLYLVPVAMRLRKSQYPHEL
jgi:hypothetical protein